MAGPKGKVETFAILVIALSSRRDLLERSEEEGERRNSPSSCGVEKI